MGIQRKILLGFIMIGLLLFLSGLISSMELTRLNRATARLLEWSRRTIELSKDMLDVVQNQNTLLLMSITDNTSAYDATMATNNMLFNDIMDQTKSHADSAALDKIYKAYKSYHEIVGRKSENMDIQWYTGIYRTSYYELTYEIKGFMMLTQNHIVNFTEELESNAYRATMVGIIAIVSGIFLMFIFFYMINTFFILPVVRINRGLRNYLASNIPFDVPVHTRDEIMDIRDHVNQLITMLRTKNRE